MSIESDKYKFSGYQMPRIQLDSTGYGYIYITPNMFPNDNYGQPSPYRDPPVFEDVPAKPIAPIPRKPNNHKKLY